MKKNLFVGYEIVGNYARLGVFTSWELNANPIRMMMEERGRTFEIVGVTEFNYHTEMDDELAKSLVRRAALKFDPVLVWYYDGVVWFEKDVLEFETFVPTIISAVDVM